MHVFFCPSRITASATNSIRIQKLIASVPVMTPYFFFLLKIQCTACIIDVLLKTSIIKVMKQLNIPRFGRGYHRDTALKYAERGPKRRSILSPLLVDKKIG